MISIYNYLISGDRVLLRDRLGYNVCRPVPAVCLAARLTLVNRPLHCQRHEKLG